MPTYFRLEKNSRRLKRNSSRIAFKMSSHLLRTRKCEIKKKNWVDVSAIFANFRHENKCYYHFFAKTSSSLSKKTAIIFVNFSRKYFKIIIYLGRSQISARVTFLLTARVINMYLIRIFGIYILLIINTNSLYFANSTATFSLKCTVKLFMCKMPTSLRSNETRRG
jgi:hypothetical protein